AARAGGIDDDVVEEEQQQVLRGVRRLAVAGAERRRGREVVEGDVDRVGARGDVDVKREEVDRIARPGDLPPARADVQPHHLHQRPGRGVLAGDPFRIDERKVAALYWYHDGRMENAATRLGGIDENGSGKRRQRGEQGRNEQDESL